MVSGLVVGVGVGVGVAAFVAATAPAVADFAIVAGISSGHGLAKQFVLLVRHVRQGPHADCDL